MNKPIEKAIDLVIEAGNVKCNTGEYCLFCEYSKFCNDLLDAYKAAAELKKGAKK